MEGHPHLRQAEVLLVERLLLLLLQAGQERMQGLAGQGVLALLKDELKRPGQTLVGKSEVSLSDSESA